MKTITDVKNRMNNFISKKNKIEMGKSPVLAKRGGGSVDSKNVVDEEPQSSSSSDGEEEDIVSEPETAGQDEPMQTPDPQRTTGARDNHNVT